MLITSHLAATTGLLVGANYIGIDLNATTIFATCLLGVGIDIDHVTIKHKKSIRRLKEYKSNPKNFVQGKENLHTILQEPMAVILVFIISLIIFFYSNNVSIFLPAVALLVHVLMDSILNFENQLLWPFSKKGFKGPFKQGVKTEAVVGIILSTVSVIVLLNQLRII